MTEKTIHPVICHRDGFCSGCHFALDKLNPGKTIHYWIEWVKK